jgi:diguanylate cyclase (GGDEF)-like protein/PAS domain S-box-containing protein
MSSPDANNVTPIEKDGLEKRLLNAVFRSSIDPIILSRADGYVVAANFAACQLFKASESVLMATGRWGLIDTSDTRFFKLLEDRKETGSGRMELRMKRPDDSTFSADVSTAVLFKEKEVEYCSWIIRDVSPRPESTRLIGDHEQGKIFALNAAQIGDWELNIPENYYRRSLLHDLYFGYTEPAKEWDYDIFLSHIHPDDRARVDRRYKKSLAGKPVYEDEFRVIWPDRSVHWLWLKARFNFDGAGKAVRVLGIVSEITERRLAEQTMALYLRVLECTHNGIMIADATSPNLPLIYVNPEFEKITGYPARDVLGKNARFLNRNDLDQEGVYAIRAAVQEQREVKVELRNYKADGSLFWNELHLSPVRDSFGSVTHFVGILNDITQRKKHEEELTFNASHDVLTGLPNRALFNDRLKQAVARAPRHDKKLAVIYLDVDRFKSFNDTLGHHGGDLILKTVAEKLVSCKREGDTVARLAGDEFAIICLDMGSKEDVIAIVNRMVDCLREPLNINGKTVQATASIGISLFPDDGMAAGELLIKADLAMYASKERGRNHFQFFTASMDFEVQDRLNLEHDLRHAMASDELSLVYQPQIEFGTGKLIGIEVFTRWHHPKLGPIAPSRFIVAAEENGFIGELGEWILRKACSQNMEWIQAGMPAVPIAVNISTLQFQQSNFSDLISQILDDTGLDPKYLEIELTESAIMQCTDFGVDTLRALKRKGLRLCIDDFGTGYSSLSYLAKFPFHRLKIDQSLVEKLEKSPHAASMTKAIIRMGKSLGLRIIAEGVEKTEQATFLKRLGCQDAQGYLFSKPLAAAALWDLLVSKEYETLDF